MKTIDIVGANYLGFFSKFRATSRCIILDDYKILLTYVKKLDMYMIPGGGMEEGESDKECCLREVEEETGKKVEIGECELEINEYYSDEKYVNHYFLGKVIGEGNIHLTEGEAFYESEPRWILLSEAIKIFSSYKNYEGIEEVKRGLYYREYLAIFNVVKISM